MQGFRPDLIHSHNFHGNMLARLMRRSLPAAKLISTIHNVYEGGWLRMLAYRLTDCYVDLNTAVSEAVADRFVRLKAVPPTKCVVVRNGIEIADFEPRAERRAAIRKQMGVGGKFVWILVGRMARAKDIPNLMRAFGQVATKHPETEMWLAGAGAEAGSRRNEKVFRGAWMDRVRRLGQRRGIAGLLDAADGFVSSSRWEGMPLAVGEAMAMEKPVVATDVGGVKELVGDAGVLAPAKDSGALAEAMVGVMQRSEAERAEMGRGARERIMKNFSMDAKADQWEALYRSVVG